VFVISPESLGSGWCLGELDVAVAHAKPIVPVIVRDPDGAAVPPALAARNWLFARDADLASKV
jgi:hypothetical protein